MRELPILFNTEMVQALDAGNKTMTRRTAGLDTFNWQPGIWTFERMMLADGKFTHAFFSSAESVGEYSAQCPYGSVGDLLYVRETFFENGDEYIYRANGTCCEQFEQCECSDVGKPKWRPSIHMPKEAARIWLKVTDIRVEPITEISEADAVAEGIEELAPWPEAPDKKRFKLYGAYFTDDATFSAISSFYTMWADINGDNSVVKNPWVWVIVFEKVEK